MADVDTDILRVFTSDLDTGAFAEVLYRKVDNVGNDTDGKCLTLSPSAKLLICFNFKNSSMLLKIYENVVWVSTNFDLDETPNYPDQSCLHYYGTIVVLGGLRVKFEFWKVWKDSG